MTAELAALVGRQAQDHRAEVGTGVSDAGRILVRQGADQSLLHEIVGVDLHGCHHRRKTPQRWVQLDENFVVHSPVRRRASVLSSPARSR